ncbi:hypothetical protein [Streptomyces albidoflavus]|nr:hypothetical protein [Streptomyces albidoflavus]
MGHQQDQTTPFGVDGCTGYKVTIYLYDDDGTCVEQRMQGCSVCGT